jgi:hypothetical protein
MSTAVNHVATELEALRPRIEQVLESVDGLVPDALRRQQSLEGKGAEFESEVQTALSEAQKGIKALHEELVAVGAWRTDAVRRVTDAAEELQESYDVAREAIRDFATTIASAESRLHQLVDESSSWFVLLAADVETDTREPLDATQQRFANAADGMRQRIVQSLAADRDEVASLLATFDDTVAEFTASAANNARAVTSQITDTMDNVSTSIRERVASTRSSLAGTFEQVRSDAAKLQEQFVELRQALGDITTNVSEVAEGTQVAVESTNVGLLTARDLFENLRLTVKEIEELWSAS